MHDDLASRLTAWFATRIPDADDLRIDGLDRLDTGHSAELLSLRLVWDGRNDDVVVRLEPPAPGLLEPYDLPRQFEVMRALEPTEVRVPRALWLEETGEVLGRPFFVMSRVEGQVFERTIPDSLARDPDRARRMSEHMVDQLAAIHSVDLAGTGLEHLADGRHHLDRELAHWSAQMRRWRRAELPALELLHATLGEQRPEPCPRITLVHGDAKPGNVAFVDTEVSAVFDWELATIGDPLTDIGWAEVVWPAPSFTSVPGSLTTDELVARYERLTGIEVQHRSWYRALASFKMAVIMFVGGMLFDGGHTDDLRLADMAEAVPILTHLGLQELGVVDPPDAGPVTARPERIAQVREARAADD